MFIAFQKNPSTWLEKAICWWTRSKYFHCSFIFSDGRQFAAIPGEGCQWLSSPSQPTDWDFVKVDMTTEEETNLRIFCSSENGTPYDWWGIFASQIFNFRRPHPTKMYCSELCVTGLKRINRFPDVPACSLCPGDLHAILVCLGNKELLPI